MPDPAPPPETSGYYHEVRFEALQRPETALLLMAIAPEFSFDQAMQHVAEWERRGLFVVRDVTSRNGICQT